MKLYSILSQLVLITGLVSQGVTGQDFRLPKSIVPTHYALQLQPILDETPGFTRFTAPGHVTFTVNCTEDTSTIKIHALDLTILEHSTTVKNLEDGHLLNIASFGTEPVHHFFVINLVETLKAGSQYDIFVEFITPVSQTRLDGMYLDEYVDPATNETRYVATTLFAAISARRCFPSFDEPQLKAVFTITLARKGDYHSLSNMHVASTEPMPGMDGWYLDKFAPSPKMSTYLVAMIVSDMTYEEATAVKNSADDTRFRVYAPYYFIDRGGGLYAVNQTKTVLGQFENYFDSIFMLQKLDSVSLPRFFFSAMENWALITYNDRVLLYFPDETTEPERYRITSIVAHEVVHYYFGNLVTCEWWTWIWLNEGSATYWSYLGVELTYPEFNPWERFVSDTYQVAMEYDVTANTHPVANEPQSTADIGGIYDAIAYQKGASLIRMMRFFLTEEVLQNAIRKYLKENEFSNVEQDILFQKLQESSDESNVPLPASVKTIMDTWTKQSGYPLVRVSRLNRGQVSFTQEKFNPSASSQVADDERWWVPVSVSMILPEPKDIFFWMSPEETDTIVDIPDNGVFVVNPNSDGYYRTLYSSELLSNLIARKSNLNGLRQSAKAKLLDDYITFLKYGMTEVDLETILDGFNPETDGLLVWQTIFKYYRTKLIENAKADIVAAKNLKSRIQVTLLPLIQSALDINSIYKEEKGEKAILKTELLFWSCFLDSSQLICENYVDKTMRNWIIAKGRHSPFPVDFEETYLCIAAFLSNSYGHKIFKMSEEQSTSAGRARLLSALTCSSDRTILQQVIPHLQEGLGRLGKDCTADDPLYLRAKLRLMLNEQARDLL